MLEIPTFLKIANKKDPIPIEKGGSVLIRLETDVNDAYLDNEFSSRLKFSTNKNQIKEKSHSKLRNGKISYYLFCPMSVRITSKDKITFSLELPDGHTLTVERRRSVLNLAPEKG